MPLYKLVFNFNFSSNRSGYFGPPCRRTHTT